MDLFTALAELRQTVEAARAYAAAPRLACDPVVRATGYRFWRGAELLAASALPEARVFLPEGPSDIQVSATGPFGETARSATLVVNVVVVRLEEPRLTIQGSRDLTHWQDIPRPGDTFFRIKKERP